MDASLAEYNGKINTPTDPESYNGTMLDEIEQMIKAMLVKESDFYGTWTGLAEDGASLTVALNVSGQLQEPTTVEMDSVEFANMTLTMKDGENVYTAMIVDNSLVVIMPSMSSALLTKVTE